MESDRPTLWVIVQKIVLKENPVRCPKDKEESLVDVVLPGGLAAHHCSACDGYWVEPDIYAAWRSQQEERLPVPLPEDADMGYTPGPQDARAGLCPNCKGFLARSRIGLNPPFYVERCSRCGGIWLDQGEWEVLQQLGWDGAIDHLFTEDWQSEMREQEYAERERRATIEKLGEDLAQQIFDLTEKLAHHPNGDFGVAYLMRRFME